MRLCFMLRLQPLVNLFTGFVFGQPIPLLQLTGKLISLPSQPKAKLIPEKRATSKPVKHKPMVPLPTAWER
jgi:hypothetical protein